MTDTQAHVEDDARMKWQFANRVFAYLVVYTAIIGAMLVLAGFHFLGFALPESVLVILVSSLVATAFILLIVAARGVIGPLKR